MTRIKVLFVLPTLDGGGAERVFVHLLNHLNRERFEVALVLGLRRGTYLADLRDDIEVIELGALQSAKVVTSLARVVRRRRPDIVFSTVYSNFAALLGRAFFPRGTRVVVRESSSIKTRLEDVASRSRSRALLVETFLRRLYPRADRIVCQSDFARAEIQSILRLPAALLTRIYNPVDFPAIETLTQNQPSPYSGPARQILAVGRLRSYKGYAFLLPALAQLHARQCEAGEVPAHLTILGEGEDEAALRQLALDLKIADAVDFRSFDRNPFRWMKHADLFVSASIDEAFSNVALEAMACGTPGVLTDCPGGNREIVEEGVTGWLAPNQNAAGLADVLYDALAKVPEIDHAAVTRSCRERFDVAAITAQYEALFNNVMASRPRKYYGN